MKRVPCSRSTSHPLTYGQEPTSCRVCPLYQAGVTRCSSFAHPARVAATSDVDSREFFMKQSEEPSTQLSRRKLFSFRNWIRTSPARRLTRSRSRALTSSQRRYRLTRMNRRQAMSFLITGGALILEGGGIGAFTLGLAGKLGHGMHPSRPLLAGAIIGQTTQARNTAKDFLNPRNGKQSLLIHLPNGSFVAYEKACTHKGVFVYYDPTTHHLVCPAHGAIFDPAQKGKVVQGPATQALPQVAPHLNADGTITVR